MLARCCSCHRCHRAAGRTGEARCSSAGGGSVSGTVPNRNLFVSGVLRCLWGNPSEEWICGELVASPYRGLDTNPLELDED